MSWDHLRARIGEAAINSGEWAGAPMPVQGIRLVVEPRYPFAGLNGYCFPDATAPDAASAESDVRSINSWYSVQHMAMVHVCDDGPGTPRWACMLPEWGGTRLRHWIDTIGASKAWSIESELTAMKMLETKITPHAFRTYVLTGSFLETSKRSGVTYLFRKLRPTVALRCSEKSGVRTLTTLCLHPIGHYEGTWAGCMCPTDDVIAHLLLMRCDEHHFWQKANHHPTWSASAGV